MNAEETHELIDPDPVALAGLAISVVGLIAPLVQAFRSQPQISFTLKFHNERALVELEKTVESMQQQIKLLQRAVDRGSPDPEAQFYNAPMRLLQTSLQLPKGQSQAYQGAITPAFQAACTIGLWINNILENSPGLASKLGAKLDRPLQEVADELNKAMAEGRPIRTVIAETKTALSVLAKAIEEELDAHSQN